MSRACLKTPSYRSCILFTFRRRKVQSLAEAPHIRFLTLPAPHGFGSRHLTARPQCSTTTFRPPPRCPAHKTVRLGSGTRVFRQALIAVKCFGKHALHTERGVNDAGDTFPQERLRLWLLREQGYSLCEHGSIAGSDEYSA